MPHVNSPFVHLLRWRALKLFDLIGIPSLLIAGLPLCLLAIWLGIFAPQTALQRAELISLKQQLRPALPLAQQQPDLQQKISVNAWQQVRMIFDLLKINQLNVEASRYQLNQGDGQQMLKLDIPLKGEYLPLMQALESLSRTLPVEVSQLTLQRATPTLNTLNVTLQLQLKKDNP